MVDQIANDGYLELGYNTVNIDDCWSEMSRDPKTNRLVPDKKRFSNGIQSLVEYARGKNVSLGIYSDAGDKTCQGYPGTFSNDGKVDNTLLDAQTFAEWGVDSLKLDGCFNEKIMNLNYTDAYVKYSQALGKQCK